MPRGTIYGSFHKYIKIVVLSQTLVEYHTNVQLWRSGYYNQWPTVWPPGKKFNGAVRT